jgi:hypothetical protein
VPHICVVFDEIAVERARLRQDAELGAIDAGAEQIADRALSAAGSWNTPTASRTMVGPAVWRAALIVPSTVDAPANCLILGTDAAGRGFMTRGRRAAAASGSRSYPIGCRMAGSSVCPPRPHRGRFQSK